MSTETVQQKKKGKRSYSDLLDEFKDVLSKTGLVLIPEMCQALRDENPNWTNEEIKDTIQYDLRSYRWSDRTIDTYFPSWVHNDAAVKRAKKGWETRNANELNKAQKSLVEITKNPIKEPKLPDETGDDDDEEDQFIGEPLLRDYGDSGESVISLYGKINGPARELFKGLTKKEIPGMHDDLILDYLKPSREFRKGIFYEVDEGMRVGLYNTLVFVRDAINDTLTLLDTIENGKQGRSK